MSDLARAKAHRVDVELETLTLARKWIKSYGEQRRQTLDALADAARRLDRATQDVELLEDEDRRVRAIEVKRRAIDDANHVRACFGAELLPEE